MRPYEDHVDVKPRRHSSREMGRDGEEDSFLDRMSGLLDAIARECATIGRTDDASAVLAKATTAFEGVQRLCREAGIVDADADDERSPPTKSHSTRVVPVRSHELPSHSSQTKRPSREMDLKLDRSNDMRGGSEDGSLPPPTPLRCRLPLSTGEDIIEVEITDILTSTQEEIQRWKHEFRLQMMEQEARQHDQNRVHMEQIQTLQDALSESQRHIAKLARTIQDTNEKLEASQALHTKSQKAMELTLKEHTSYWKSICHDLVSEKRAIATKLAEERGKYHALREHLGLHESADKLDADDRTTTKAKQREPFPSKTVSSRTAYGSTSAHATKIDDYRTTDDASPPRASFRRYYLSKS